MTMQLSVFSIGGDCQTLDVSPGDKIAAVIKQSQPKLTPEQRYYYILVYNDEVLNNAETVEHYKLGAGSKVLLRLLNYVWVQREVGGPIRLDVWEDVNVRGVKNIIQKLRRIPPEQQLLTYRDELLSEDDCQLRWYGLQHVTAISWYSRCDLPRCTMSLTLLSESDDSTDGSAQRVTEAALASNATQSSKRLKTAPQKQHDELVAKVTDLSTRVKKMEKENEVLRKQLCDIKSQLLRGNTKVRGVRRTIVEKFVGNFTEFLDLDLDIAEHLLQENVLSNDKYIHVCDRNRNLSTKQRVKEMLEEVMISDRNVRALLRILKKRTDNRSKELAKLLK